MLYRLRGLREDADLSQQELAEILHVHQTTYSDYELGRLNVPIHILIQLAQYFHTSVGYLLELTDQREPYPRGAKQ